MDWTKYSEGLDKVRKLSDANKRIAIHACLEQIYIHAAEAFPRLIVELGAGMEQLSTQVLSWAAALHTAHHVGIDKADRGKRVEYEHFHFVHGDDIEFARLFASWANQKGITPIIDVLFIDTDELYDHVKLEISSYFPFLSADPTVMLRCTNLQKRLVYEDGTFTSLGWDNQRGVIRALGDSLGIVFDETKPYEDYSDHWFIKHLPWGAGLTILRKAVAGHGVPRHHQ